MYKIVLKKKKNNYIIIARNTNKKNKKNIAFVGNYNNIKLNINMLLLNKLIKNGAKLSKSLNKIINENK
ncbi:hypothetical protein ACWNYO_00310 [Candidatus Vidania fulgoroideorum]